MASLHLARSLAFVALLGLGINPASAQTRGPAKAMRAKKPSVLKKHRVSSRNTGKSRQNLKLATSLTVRPRTHHLSEGIGALLNNRVDGISKPHPDVVKQLTEVAGGKLRGPVYVIRYGTEAAQRVSDLTKTQGMGMIYKGSAGNGHSMLWVGGQFTDAVPGRFSFSGGAKTRFHEFTPQSERPQLVAAFDLPTSIIGKATENAKAMASSKRQCGADCSGYVREIALTTSAMAKAAGSSNGIAELAAKIPTYQAPITLRNTSLGLADVVILMVSKNDWRKPESAGYSIHDWNGK